MLGLKSRTTSKVYLFCLVGILVVGCAYLAPRDRAASQDDKPPGNIGDTEKTGDTEKAGNPNRF